MKGIVNYRHSGNMGDVIYALSGIKCYCEKFGVKANLFLNVDVPAQYYKGAIHPVYDSTGRVNVMLNNFMVNMAIPLLEYQDYIEGVYVWQGEEAVNLDKIRQYGHSIGMPNGCIKRWIGYVYPDMQGDYSQQCITVPETTKQIKKYGDYILVNRTQRYTNLEVSYMFLKKYPKVIFAGTSDEYSIFQSYVPTAVHLKPMTFLELAQWIAYSKVFIGNQSFCYSLAEQMKTKRVLEVCSYAPNVIPSGRDGYDFYDQNAFEYLVDKLWKGETP